MRRILVFYRKYKNLTKHVSYFLSFPVCLFDFLHNLPPCRTMYDTDRWSPCILERSFDRIVWWRSCWKYSYPIRWIGNTRKCRWINVTTKYWWMFGRRCILGLWKVWTYHQLREGINISDIKGKGNEEIIILWDRTIIRTTYTTTQSIKDCSNNNTYFDW